MRVTKKFAEGLILLVELLNWEGARPAKTSGLYDLIVDLDLNPDGKVKFHEGITKEKLAEARQLKDEFIKDLSALISGEGKRPWKDLDDLVDKISGLGLRPKLRLDPGEKMVHEAQFQLTPGKFRHVIGTQRKVTNPAYRHLGPNQRILVLHGTKWIVRRWYPESAPVRERLYWTISNALENGELAGLRMCPTCKIFFLAADLRRRFCSQRCKDEFFNLEKAKTGYFKANRKERKKQRLNAARKLLDKGESEDSVMEQLGLTRKALAGLAGKGRGRA
jgi:hypothetical protein